MGRKLFNNKDYNKVIQLLEYSWAIGASDAEAALVADISTAALSDFLKKNSNISARKEALKNRPVLEARKCLVEAIKTDPELALKYLERVRRKEFSTRAEIEHEGHVTLEQLIAATWEKGNGVETKK